MMTALYFIVIAIQKKVVNKMIIRMIGKIFLVCVIGIACAWWYWIDGSRLSHDKIKAFYNRGGIAISSRKPDELCTLLANDYHNTGPSLFANYMHENTTQNREQICAEYKDTFRKFDEIGTVFGGTLKIQYSLTIHKIIFSTDNMTATVYVSYSLDVGDTLMNTKLRSIDTLIQRNGKILLLRSYSETQ